MAGDIQRGSHYSGAKRRGAALAFGGGRQATVRRDYRPAKRTLLRAGDRVKVFEPRPEEGGGFVYAYREGSKVARKIPSSYLDE